MPKHNKWSTVRAEADGIEACLNFFDENLIDHLEKPHDPKGKTNQPFSVILGAKNTIGTLSRIFDEFSFPVPAYEQMKKISEKPNGLRIYLGRILDALRPVLLNKDNTALDPFIIEAIGAENYEDLQQKGEVSEKKIATKFLEAVLVAYGQRVIDKIAEDIKDNEEEKNRQQVEAFESITPDIATLANEVTLEGLPQLKEKRIAENAAPLIDKLALLLEDFASLMSESGSSAPGDIHDRVEAKLMKASSSLEKGAIETAYKEYNDACLALIDGAKTCASQVSELKKPEVNWLIKALRWISKHIFGRENERLFQTKSERLYDKQIQQLTEVNSLIATFEIAPQARQEADEVVKVTPKEEPEDDPSEQSRLSEQRVI